jgi:hypothetical protein
MKVQTMKSLFAEMRAVARGEIPVPADATEPSIEPVDFTAFDRIMRRKGGEPPSPEDTLE